MTLSSIEYLNLFENTSFMFHTINITKLIIYFKLSQIKIKKLINYFKNEQNRYLLKQIVKVDITSKFKNNVL